MTFFDLSFFLFSLFLIIKSASYLVEYSLAIGKILHLSPLLTGITILAVGTSLPELAISMVANLEHQVGISLGNIIGSNITNSTLVLGLSFLLFPIRIGTRKTQSDNVILLMITAIFSGWLVLMNQTNFGVGLIFIFLSMLTFIYQIRLVKDDDTLELTNHHHLAPKRSLDLSLLNVLFRCLFFSVVIFLASHFLVQSSLKIINQLQISGEVFALTIIAIGTSLPEFFTTLAAAGRKEAKLLVGNILGSNLFNLLFIGGASSLINPLYLEEKNVLIFWPLSTLFLFYVIRKSKGLVVSKIYGFSLLLVFFLFLIFLTTQVV